MVQIDGFYTIRGAYVLSTYVHVGREGRGVCRRREEQEVYVASDEMGDKRPRACGQKWY